METPKKSKGESGVYRRQSAVACIGTGLLMSILSAFGVVDADVGLITPTLGTGTALMGAGLVKDHTQTKYGK